MATSIAPVLPQTLELPPFPVYRFTLQQYHQMARAGILTDDDKVELLEGWIVPKMVKHPPHDTVIDMIQEALRARLSQDWRVRIQSAISTIQSESEPDLAVVRGPAKRYLDRHPEPEDAALVIEVAESSLDRDRWKAQIYARAGIPVYWIVNLIDTRLEVYTDPIGREAQARYQHHVNYSSHESVPLVIEGQE